MKRYKNRVCESISSQLSAYFDKQIPVWKRHLIRRHLDRCSKCQSEFNSIQQTDRFLQFVEPVKVSDTFLSDVLEQATEINRTDRVKHLYLNRFGSLFDGIQGWLRGKIRAYNPVFMFGFIFGVFIMIGATLYSPRIEKFNPIPQFLTKSTEAHQNRFISFEVISQQEPKRTLKNR